MAIEHPTIKQLVAELSIDKKTATAVKYIMRNYSDTAHAKTKLKPFQDLLENNFPGPTNMPRGDIHSALTLIDKLLETHGIEYIQFKDGQGYRIDVAYCNTGDTYANTLHYSTATSAFTIGSWGDLVEEYEGHGYKALDKHEYVY